MIATKQYKPPFEFFREQVDSGIHFFDDVSKFVDDFCFDENWHMLDQVVANYKNKEVDTFNKKIRARYWTARGKPLPDQFECGDEVIFQELNIDKAGIILHLNNDHAIIQKTERLWSDKLSLWYWKCVDRDNLPFMVIDDKSRKNYKKLLGKVASNAKKESDREKKKSLWKVYFLLKEQFTDVKHRFAMTIHKLQGSTYDTVYINLYDLINRTQNLDLFYRLIYVAVTRASKEIKILMPPLDKPRPVHKSIEDVEAGFDEIADLLG
jgi:hypothetical protein